MALRHHGDREVRPGDVDHAVNVLAGGPPKWLTDALGRTRLDAYPDPGPAQVALARLHGRRPEEVVITNGAAEALWLLGPALRPARAILVQPGFTETEVALRAHGIPVERIIDAEPHAGRSEQPRELMVWTNPTSPDGRLRSAAMILAAARPGRTLVVDEAFMSMVPGEPESLAGTARPDLIVVRSLTKLLSVAGLRVGYALAAPELAGRLRAVQPPWSANTLALAALEAAARHPEALRQRAHRAEAERRDLAHRLAPLERAGRLRVHPSVTNFVLIDVPGGAAVHAALRARGVAVRGCASFPGCSADQLRVTAREPGANARLVALLAEILNG